jgi:hypothetical protein
MNIMKAIGGIFGKKKSPAKKKKSTAKNKRSWTLDRMYASKEDWEKAYTPSKRKGTPKKHPRQK